MAHASQNLTPDQRLALLETLLDRVPDFFYVHNAELRFQYANRAAAEYFGRPKEELPGLLHREVDSDPEQAAFFEAELIPIIERGEPVTTEDLPYLRRDGTPGLIRAHIVPFDNPSSGERMMLGISRDVTEERQAAIEREARAAFERELDIARRVQQSLFPGSIPELTGFDIAARCEPAHFAGGDFYDFIQCDGRAIVVVGDVTGHGVGPALIAASCRAYARALLPSYPLGEAMARLDQHVSADTAEGTFITLAAIELLPSSGTARYCSAGHGPVIRATRSGAHDVLPTQCPPLGLGVASRSTLEPIELELAQGDLIILPSDGLIESQSPDGRQRGVDGLMAAASGTTSDQIVSSCFDADALWRDDEPASDDQTLVVIRAV